MYVIFNITLSSQQWMGHLVEDVQQGAVCRCHQRVPFISRGHCLSGEPGSEIRWAFSSQRLRHYRVLQSRQLPWRTPAEFHDRKRQVPRVLHPRHQSGHVRSSKEKVQHREGWQSVVQQRSELHSCSCLNICCGEVSIYSDGSLFCKFVRKNE